MDNSPMWDSLMERMWLGPEQIPEYRRADTHVVSTEDRPLDAAYDRAGAGVHGARLQQPA
jgi:hypothetical protein